MDIECGGFTFVSNFDSGNLARVEFVSKRQNEHQNPGKNSPAEEIPDFEFNIWTKPDCAGTEFENNYRTWFYFGVKGGAPFVLVKLNIMNLNRQAKMYSQGMTPVFRMVPGRSHWDRIKEKPSYTVDDKVFILSFKYRTLENIRATTYFAFTYPYTYVELQKKLNSVDTRFRIPSGEFQTPNCLDDIYYHRECVCYSLEGRMVDLITISSHHSMSSEREIRLKNLFPMVDVPRPFRFNGKKVIFVSARVHPGETPSSFVLNGLLNLLLARDDPIALLLRKMYVFKLIPMLNPDGVSQGHYRTDTRGVNLNRMYLNPVFELHPSIYAARSLIRYYHHGQEKEEELTVDSVVPDIVCDSSGDLLLNVNEQGKVKCSGAVTVSSLEAMNAEKQDNSRNMEDIQWLSDTNRLLNIENKVSGLSLDEEQNESSYYCASDTKNSTDINLCSSSSSMVFPDNRDVSCTVRDNVLNDVDNGDVTSKHSSSTLSVLSEGVPEKSVSLAAVASVLEAPTISLCRSEVDESVTDSVFNGVVDVDGCLPDIVPSVCKKVLSTYHSVGSSYGGVGADANSKEDCQHLQHEGEGLKIIKAEGFDSNSNKYEDGLSNLVHSKKVTTRSEDTGLYLYVDLHGHASKKGL